MPHIGLEREFDKVEKLYNILKELERLQPEDSWQTIQKKNEVVECWQVLEQTLKDHGIYYEGKNRGT